LLELPPLEESHPHARPGHCCRRRKTPSNVKMNMRALGSLDMYRKVPTDLMEGTKRGSYLSMAAMATMLTLFLLETRAFLRTE
jgi:hypothetical protein